MKDYSKRINQAKEKRLEHQNFGRNKIKNHEPLYIAGCMLYWGEGSKDINSVKFTNSDLAMLKLFKEFLQKFFEIKNSEFVLTINCYTDLHSQTEIEEFWLSNLVLERSSLRKGQINNLPKSSKNSKKKKLEYGTCALIVHRTDIVQEIFGAIQEFGNFENINWLTKITNNIT